MNRRTTLAALATGLGGLAGLAGCIGRSSSGPTPTARESPSAVTETESETRTPRSATDRELDVVDCPRWPDSLTATTVGAFVAQFERAYVARRTMRETSVDIVSIDVYVDESSLKVTEADDGWVVRFDVVGPAYRYRPSPESTETEHVDPPAYVASYLVTDREVRRAQAVEAVDPRSEGVPVSCPPA